MHIVTREKRDARERRMRFDIQKKRSEITTSRYIKEDVSDKGRDRHVSSEISLYANLATSLSRSQCHLLFTVEKEKKTRSERRASLITESERDFLHL